MLNAACSSSTGTTPGGPDASVILQPNARIADGTTRQALLAFDRDAGTLRFAPGAPQVAEWTAGDVVVSAACPGAPAGYLRRVVSVAKDSSGTVLTTVQASLGEVIKNGGAEGSFVIKTRPSPADGGSVVVGSKSPALDIGDQRTFDVEYHNDNFRLSAKGHEATFAGVKLRVNIDGWCEIDGDPCFEFAATADLSDHFDIVASAFGQKEWNQSFPIADDTYDPIELDIGPVPLVFVPHIESTLDVDESVNAEVHITANGNGPDFQLAVHWDSSNGFSSDKSLQPATMDGTADFDGEATAHAKLPTTLRLLLYDLGGVEVRLTPELTARLHAPGKPHWALDGRFIGEIGVTAQLPIIGDLGSYDQTLFDESFRVAQSVNIPPSANILLPFPGQPIDIAPPDNATVQLIAQAFDTEDGEPCCTFRWSLADGTAIAEGNDVSYTFPRPGHYVVVATATDSDGASGDSPPVGIDIVAYPPGARIVLPSSTCSVESYVGLPVRIRGHDTRPPLAPLPYDCTFGSQPLVTGGQDPQFPMSVPREQVTEDGCDITTRFTFADYRDLHLLVRQYNPDGTVGFGSVVDRTILVVSPPPGAVPILMEPGPPACAQELLGYSNGRLDLYVQTFGDDSTGVEWQWEPTGCLATPIPATKQPLGVCTPDYCPAHYTIRGSDVFAATAAGCGGMFAAGQLSVTATSASAPPQSTTLYVKLFDDVIH
jgi:hypothetical protein